MGKSEIYLHSWWIFHCQCWVFWGGWWSVLQNWNRQELVPALMDIEARIAVKDGKVEKKPLDSGRKQKTRHGTSRWTETKKKKIYIYIYIKCFSCDGRWKVCQDTRSCLCFVCTHELFCWKYYLNLFWVGDLFVQSFVVSWPGKQATAKYGI